MTLDITKPLRMRSGAEVTLLCTDLGGKYPLLGTYINDEGDKTNNTWTLDGLLLGGETCEEDLINVPEETYRWISLHEPLSERDSELFAIRGMSRCEVEVGETQALLKLTYKGDVLSKIEVEWNGEGGSAKLMRRRLPSTRAGNLA